MGDDIVAGKSVDLDLEEATAQRELFFEACPGIRPYQDDCIAQTSWTNPEQNQLYDNLVGDTVTYIKAPCGRIRSWTKDQNPYAEAPNFPIQGSSATGIKLAMILLQRQIDAAGWDANILLPVHDELITEAHADIAELVSEAQRECMEAAFASFCPDVPIKAEFPEKSDRGVCDRWLK
jgi:DNA polymerase-1